MNTHIFKGVSLLLQLLWLRLISKAPFGVDLNFQKSISTSYAEKLGSIAAFFIS